MKKDSVGDDLDFAWKLSGGLYQKKLTARIMGFHSVISHMIIICLVSMIIRKFEIEFFIQYHLLLSTVLMTVISSNAMFITKDLTRQIYIDIKEASWTSDIFGDVTKRRLLKDAKSKKVIFIVMQCAIIVASMNMMRCLDIKFFLKPFLGQSSEILNVVEFFYFLLAPIPIYTAPYLITYITYHMIYQQILFNEYVQIFLEKCERQVIKNVDNMIYQNEVEKELVAVIKRHIQLRRLAERINQVSEKTGFFILGGFLALAMSVTLEIIKGEQIFLTANLAVSGTLIGAHLFYPGQQYLDEVEKTYEKMCQTNWYTWNAKNKKIYSIYLYNSMQYYGVLNLTNEIGVSNSYLLKVLQGQYFMGNAMYQLYHR